MKDFDRFMDQLMETNQTLGFFCDFDKAEQNVSKVKVKLLMLNNLLGSENMREAVEEIWEINKSAFQVLGILIAVRDGSQKKVLDGNGRTVNLASYYESVDGIMEFLELTGLMKLFMSNKIHNLVDYVFGIEIGLDTNARKNRSGHLMEAAVANLFSRNNIAFNIEVYSRQWSAIRQVLGTDDKRFDFVIATPAKTYLIEVNFYSDGGSKPNEVARAYSDIGPKINSVSGFEFVWITDGIGWHKAKNKIQEAYSIIPKVYNLTDVQEFIDIIKSES
ncbi:MAG: type II restriction endonuclease [Marinilabiliaceae bacterium]|nr:type II restriction endonuclease [Bacteroidales bacterium]